MSRALRSTVALAVSFVLLVAVATSTRAQERSNHRPEGVRILENKSFDDSRDARREILDLYEELEIPLDDTVRE